MAGCGWNVIRQPNSISYELTRNTFSHDKTIVFNKYLVKARIVYKGIKTGANLLHTVNSKYLSLIFTQHQIQQTLALLFTS